MSETSSPVFSFRLDYDVEPFLVTVGKYDGSHSCITAVTSLSKILIHTPHRTNKEISILDMKQTVTAIKAGKLLPNDDKDILVVGTATTVLAYHVHDNRDVFFIDVPDGANAIEIGCLGSSENSMVIIGGNCSIQGFDWQGKDVYWTITGDNVTALALVDINSNGYNHLAVGSEDFDIRIFKEDELLYEISETEKVSHLFPFKNGQFAYALANGTVGVYEKTRRIWRVKSKLLVRSLAVYDLNRDEEEELIIGWSNGKVDARNSRTGEIIFTDNLSRGISGIVTGDYRQDGTNQIIVISQIGEVRGYDINSLTTETYVRPDISRELLTKKQALITELKNYTLQAAMAPGIPGNTRLMTKIAPTLRNKYKREGHVLLSLSTNNGVLIRAAIIFSEGIFEGETLMVYPASCNVSDTLLIPLVFPTNHAVDLHIRAFITSEASNEQMHIYETRKQLPKFSMYLVVPFSAPQNPSSFVTLSHTERIQRFDTWLSSNFLLPTHIPVDKEGETSWQIGLKSIRSENVINIKYDSGEISLISDDIELVAEIIQSLIKYLRISDVKTYAEFPEVFEELKLIFEQALQLKENASRISATLADNSASVKLAVVQIEDARILECMDDVRQHCKNLRSANDEMMKNHIIQCSNYDQLTHSLKRLNAIIISASKLRDDKVKKEMITECRKAFLDDNVNILTNLIRTGKN